MEDKKIITVFTPSLVRTPWQSLIIPQTLSIELISIDSILNRILTCPNCKRRQPSQRNSILFKDIFNGQQCRFNVLQQIVASLMLQAGQVGIQIAENDSLLKMPSDKQTSWKLVAWYRHGSYYRYKKPSALPIWDLPCWCRKYNI